MRLIDADKFKRQIAGMAVINNYPAEKANKMCELIDCQFTAYDVEKVIKRLNEELLLADKEKERCVKENPLQFDASKGYAQGIAAALEIIRSGGVANG